MNFKSQFIELNLLIWIQLILLVLLLSVARQVSFLSFVDFQSTIIPYSDYLKLIKTGALYDLRAASISFILFYLVGAVTAIHKKIFAIYKYLFSWYCALIGFVFMLVAICNYYYFQTYGNNFDIFIFNAQTEDTRALLSTIWQQYPVFWAIITSLIFSSVSYQLAKPKNLKKYTATKISNINFTLFFVVAFFIFLLATRGSLGSYPLVRTDAQISNILILNKINPNAFFSIYWAHKDNKHNNYSIKKVSFQEITELSQKIFQDNNLLKNTEKNEYLENNKPHVVFAIMEAMATNLLKFDDYPENDLLGELRVHFEKDYLFNYFLGNSYGTKPALANILFNSPYPGISHNLLQKTYIPGNAFEAYQKAGYKVIFISPSNMMWYNMVNFLSLHNVEVVDENTLMQTYPISKEQKKAWGLPDEYAFNYAKKILQEANQPLLIIVLSASNHAPYNYPRSYQPKSIKVPEEYQSDSSENLEDSVQAFQTFQYAANSLGQFITSVKQSKFASQTIIGATADHYFRKNLSSNPKDLVIDTAVPFYIYIPEKIKEYTKINYTKDRYGSHKDIFPTLMSYSLSEAEYYNAGGKNMLSEEVSDEYNFGYSDLLWIDDSGAYPLKETIRLYPWDKDLLTNSTSIKANQKMVDKINAFKRYDKLQFNYRVMGVE